MEGQAQGMAANVRQFREQYAIAESCNLDSHAVSIDALFEVRELATAWLSEIDNSSGQETFVVLAYLNLVERIFEQASGMLVCLAVSAWSSAEALSRVVLEASVNLRCLSRDGGEQPLLAFFDSWLDEHELKLTLWREVAVRDKDQENLERITARVDCVLSTRAALNSCIMQLGLARADAPSEAWPSSVYDRFRLVGMEADYRSTYHRMSSASHSLAEDSLNWLLLMHTPNSQAALRAAGEESVAYSAMLAQISLFVAVESMVACCVSKGLTETSIGEKHRAALGREIKRIAPLAGVPQV